ncbi:MAG TPA: alpha/beta fold hydrolase [Stellaceae bacterium]
MAHDLAPRIVVTEDGREVGYRRFGDGPPVVLLHASPRSAAVLLPLAERLADRFTVFAFDTPGFGWSQPLRIARPDAADFGHALIAALDALGLDRVPVYGSHTGAAIAVAAGLLYPARISALVLDGYAMFTPAEHTEYASFYLTPIRPDWAGTHLAWLWSRVKDQFTVFPWHLLGQWARLPRALLTPDAMQQVVIDFLAAGDAYRAAYAAAFRFDGGPPLRALTVPTIVMARSDDLLFGHLDVLGDLPANVSVQKLGEDHAAWARAIGDAMAPGATGTAPPVPAPAPRFLATGLAQSVVRVPGGTIGLAACGRGKGRTLVLLPAIPGSARGEAPLLRALGRDRAILALDPPGFGASHLSGQPDIDGIAAALAASLRAVGVIDFDIAAIGESAGLGCALAARAPQARLVLIDPVPDDDRAALVREMADITPRRDGAHLLASWHQLRDRRLWRPWFDARPAQALDCGTDPDVETLQAIITDWMRGDGEGAQTLAAALAQPLSALVPPLRARTSMIVVPAHPWSVAMAAFAAENGLSLRQVPDERTARAAAIAEVLAP